MLATRAPVSSHDAVAPSATRSLRPRWHWWWRATALAFDVVALLIAIGGAAVLRFGNEATSLSGPWLFISLPMWVGAMAVFGLYSPARCGSAMAEARGLISSAVAAPTAFILLGFLLRSEPSRLWVGMSAVGGMLLVGLGRRGLRRTTAALHTRGHWITRALIAGNGSSGALVDSLLVDTTSGIQPVGTSGFTHGALPRYSKMDLRRAVAELRANAIVIVAQDFPHDDVQRAVTIADDFPVNVYVVPGLDYTLTYNLHVVSVGPEPALAVELPSLRLYQRLIKRIFDVVASSLALVVLSPLLLAIAVLVGVTTRGPVVFKQHRTGYRGREFEVLKFRTMVVGAHEMLCSMAGANEADGPLFKIRHDPRRTRVGIFLRRSSFDELPQLWNVIRGDMSLVGPRPALPTEVATYDKSVARRLVAKPGITGMWQIEGRTTLPFAEYVRLDITYVQNWNLLLDLYILLLTPLAMLKRSHGR